VREHVLELLLGERGQVRALGAHVERDQEADVDRAELERRLALRDRGDHLVEVATGRRHRLRFIACLPPRSETPAP
jgi:hypothetical protein